MARVQLCYKMEFPYFKSWSSESRSVLFSSFEAETAFSDPYLSVPDWSINQSCLTWIDYYYPPTKATAASATAATAASATAAAAAAAFLVYLFTKSKFSSPTFFTLASSLCVRECAHPSLFLSVFFLSLFLFLLSSPSNVPQSFYWFVYNASFSLELFFLSVSWLLKQFFKTSAFLRWYH